MCMDVILCVRDGRQFLLSQRKTFSSACFNINIHVIYKTNKHSPYKATPTNNSLTLIKPNRLIIQRNSPSASLYFLYKQWTVNSHILYLPTRKRKMYVHMYVLLCYLMQFVGDCIGELSWYWVYISQPPRHKRHLLKLYE